MNKNRFSGQQPPYKKQMLLSSGVTVDEKNNYKFANIMNPWASIWLNPRGTIRQIVDTDPRRSLLLLAAGGGVAQACNFAVNMALGSALELDEIILFILAFGPLAGFLSLWLWTLALTFVTRWFGGLADRSAVRAAVAWSWAPTVYLLPLWGVRYILFRDELFKDARPFVESHGLLSALYSFFGGVDLLLSFLTVFILVQTIAEVSRFSVWRSMGAILFVLLLLLLPLLAAFLIMPK
ncbi:MAG: YIP1 family protein [candidate division KSB1 bacterium]|nr:YIP1 family protein [candidate division KSB1 bacterium]MDZ7345333.1 YIP1 family protein [candidate division KSB1 bacterium]